MRHGPKRRNLCETFLKNALRDPVTGEVGLNQYSKVGGQPSISQSTIYELKIPLPPLEEQKQIVAQIEREQSLVNANKELIAIYEQKIKDEINRLWEQ
jgi:type I restriction enzyme M protein